MERRIKCLIGVSTAVVYIISTHRQTGESHLTQILSRAFSTTRQPSRKRLKEDLGLKTDTPMQFRSDSILIFNCEHFALVGGVGFEPTHPKGPDLQSGAALQLDRPPKYIALPCICLTSTSATYRPTPVPGEIWVAQTLPGASEKTSPMQAPVSENSTRREDFRISFELQKSCLYTTAANSAITTTLGRGEGSWTRTKKNARF